LILGHKKQAVCTGKAPGALHKNPLVLKESAGIAPIHPQAQHPTQALAQGRSQTAGRSSAPILFAQPAAGSEQEPV